MGSDHSKSASSDSNRPNRTRSGSNSQQQYQNHQSSRHYQQQPPAYFQQTSQNPSSDGFSYANLRASQQNQMILNNFNAEACPPLIVQSNPTLTKSSMSKHVPEAQKNPTSNINVKTTSTSVAKKPMNNNNSKKPLIIDLDEMEKRINNLSLPHKEAEIFNGKLKSKEMNEARANLVANSYLSDVKFIVNGATVPAHKSLVITSSSLFHQVFEQNKELTMKIDDIDNETFMGVLKYCYTDKIKVNSENVQKLLIAADKLKVKQIVNICHGYISNLMNSESIFEILEQAMNYKDENIEKKCLEYISKNEQKCFNSVSFFNIPLDNLKKILEFCKFSSEKQKEIICKHLEGPISFQKPSYTKQANQNVNNLQQNQQKKKMNNENQNLKNQSARSRSKSRNRNKAAPQMSILQPSKLEYPNNLPKSDPIAQLLGDVLNNNLPKLNPIRPFADQPLIILDDDDETPTLITHDDEDNEMSSGQIKAVILGKRMKKKTQFSRVDFICKTPMTIQKIFLSEDLSKKGCELMMKVCSYDHKNEVKDLHTRTFRTSSKMPLNFINLSRTPLSIFGGQKFFIKIKFNECVEVLHINANEITPNEFVELRKESDVKNYFNCVSSLVVSATS